MNDLARESCNKISGAAIDLILKTADSVDLQAIFNSTGLPPLTRSGRKVALAKTPSAAQLASAFYPVMSALCLQSPQPGIYDAPTNDDIDLFCSCLINCENLGAVIDRAIRFTKISNDRWGELNIDTKNEQSFFYMNSRRIGETATAVVLDVFGLCFFYKLFSWLIAEPLLLLRIDIARKPLVDELAVAQIFDCPVTFESARTALIFDQTMLKKPVMRTYRELVGILELLPIALMPLPRVTSVSSHVEMIFFRKAMEARTEIPSLEQVANLLGKSVSTLRRHLMRENTSFQAIVDRWRMQRSGELLSNTELTIDDIAAMLGFSGPSVFSRAFKSWTGFAPSAYRQTLSEQRGTAAPKSPNIAVENA
jgi:AraC-like DNA-binding protein